MQMSNKYETKYLVDSCGCSGRVQQSETAVTEAAVAAGGGQKSETAVTAEDYSRTR